MTVPNQPNGLTHYSTNFFETVLQSKHPRLYQSMLQNNATAQQLERLPFPWAKDQAKRLRICAIPVGLICPTSAERTPRQFREGGWQFWNCGRALCARCSDWRQREWARNAISAILPTLTEGDRHLFLTFTVSHTMSTPLRWSHDVLRQALGQLYNTNTVFKRACATRIACVEIPFNACNGFSPHCHILLRLRESSELFQLPADEIKAVLRNLWRTLTETRGLRSWIVDVEEPTTPNEIKRILDYFAKLPGALPKEGRLAVCDLPPGKFQELALTLYRRQMMPLAAGPLEGPEFERSWKWRLRQRRQQEKMNRKSPPQTVMVHLGKMKRMIKMNSQAASLTLAQLADWHRDYLLVLNGLWAQWDGSNNVPYDFIAEQQDLLRAWQAIFSPASLLPPVGAGGVFASRCPEEAI